MNTRNTHEWNCTATLRHIGPLWISTATATSRTSKHRLHALAIGCNRNRVKRRTEQRIVTQALKADRIW